MAEVKVNRIPQPPVESVTVELSLFEAQYLSALNGATAGTVAIEYAKQVGADSGEALTAQTDIYEAFKRALNAEGVYRPFGDNYVVKSS